MAAIPKPITDDQYDRLMRELWEIRQVMSNYQMDTKLRDQVEIMVNELEKTRAENKIIKKMLIKIGTKLFQKGLRP